MCFYLVSPGLVRQLDKMIVVGPFKLKYSILFYSITWMPFSIQFIFSFSLFLSLSLFLFPLPFFSQSLSSLSHSLFFFFLFSFCLLLHLEKVTRYTKRIGWGHYILITETLQLTSVFPIRFSVGNTNHIISVLKRFSSLLLFQLLFGDRFGGKYFFP